MDDDEARELMERVAAAKQEGRDIDRWLREKGGQMGELRIEKVLNPEQAANPVSTIGEDFKRGWEHGVGSREPGPLEEICTLCHVLLSTGTCRHLLDLGHGRVGMPRKVWEDLVEDRLKLERITAVVAGEQDD